MSLKAFKSIVPWMLEFSLVNLKLLGYYINILVWSFMFANDPSSLGPATKFSALFKSLGSHGAYVVERSLSCSCDIHAVCFRALVCTAEMLK